MILDLLEVVLGPRFVHQERSWELLGELLLELHVPVLVGFGRLAEDQVEVVDDETAVGLLERNLITVSNMEGTEMRPDRYKRQGERLYTYLRPHRKREGWVCDTLSFFIISRSCRRMLAFSRRASISTSSMYCKSLFETSLRNTK